MFDIHSTSSHDVDIELARRREQVPARSTRYAAPRRLFGRNHRTRRAA